MLRLYPVRSWDHIFLFFSLPGKWCRIWSLCGPSEWASEESYPGAAEQLVGDQDHRHAERGSPAGGCVGGDWSRYVIMMTTQSSVTQCTVYCVGQLEQLTSHTLPARDLDIFSEFYYIIIQNPAMNNYHLNSNYANKDCYECFIRNLLWWLLIYSWHF